MAKRKSFEEKNKFIHPTRKKIIDKVFGREDNTTHVFGHEAKEVHHKVGDIWTDSNGTTWEQKGGYKVNHTQFDDIRKYLNNMKQCSASDCQTTKLSSADKKLIKRTGLCTECLIKFEHPLRVDGTFRFYEDYKITLNKLSYIKEMYQKYEQALRDVKEVIEIVNEDGTIEKWKSNIDVEKVKDDIKSDMKNAEEAIELLFQRKAALEEKFIELNHPELIKK